MPLDDFEDFEDATPDMSSMGRSFAEQMRDGVKRVTHTHTLIRWHDVLSTPSRAPQALRFLAQNSNPNQLAGRVQNLWTVLTVGALDRNCVICAKAVDLSLASLVGRSFSRSSPPADLWAAEGTGPGDLHFLRSLPPDQVRPFRSSNTACGSVAEGIFTLIHPGERAIVVVPVRGARYLHALNAVHLPSGARFFIDGQRGELYERSNWGAFDHRFRWPELTRPGDLQAGMFITGDAPDFAMASARR